MIAYSAAFFFMWLAALAIIGGSLRVLKTYMVSRLTKHIHRGLFLFVFNAFISTASVAFTVWFFTSLVFYDIYLLIFLMHIAGTALLLGLLWWKGLFSETSLQDLFVKEILANAEHQALNRITHVVLAVVGIGALIVYFYVTTGADYPANKEALYLLLISFGITMLLHVNDLVQKAIVLLSPRLWPDVRSDLLITCFYRLYNVSAIAYIALGVLSVPLSQTVVEISGVSVRLTHIVVLCILMLFVVLVVVPYSIGQNRKRDSELKLVKARSEILHELERGLDPTDVESTKKTLTGVLEKIVAKSNDVRATLVENMKKFEEFGKKILSKMEHQQWAEAVSRDFGLKMELSIRELFESDGRYLDDLNDYRKWVAYEIGKDENNGGFADLDRRAFQWKEELDGEKERIKRVRDFAQKTVGVAAATWVALNTLFGLTIWDVLTAF
jgi:hypothetical protein